MRGDDDADLRGAHACRIALGSRASAGDWLMGQGSRVGCPATMGADSGRTVSQAGEQRSARIESLRAIAALAVLAGHVILVATPFAEIDDNLLSKLLFGGGFG